MTLAIVLLSLGVLMLLVGNILYPSSKSRLARVLLMIAPILGIIAVIVGIAVGIATGQFK